LRWQAPGLRTTLPLDAQDDDESPDQPIGFGPFELYPATRILKKDMGPVDIGGRAFDILVALLRRPNEVVTIAEVVAAALYLAADATYATGAELFVDGALF
jgi:DNA-binding response OmpR family regulator